MRLSDSCLAYVMEWQRHHPQCVVTGGGKEGGKEGGREGGEDERDGNDERERKRGGEGREKRVLTVPWRWRHP